MEQYENYKESSIEWLGNIPNHWKLVRLKYLSDIGTGAKDTENKVDKGKYPFFVRSKTIERISSYSFDGEAILTAGDGEICKIWHYINGKFDYHQRVYRISHFKGTDGRYIFYFMKANFIKEVMKLSAKSTVDSLRRPMFLNFRIAFGEIDEQRKIANYLDYKTNLIDTLIFKKQNLIQLLKEEQTAIINRIVTNGLDPNTEMKHSGIDWLGEIPCHWDIKRLRYIGTCQNGISAGAEFFGIGHPFVSYSDVFNNRVLPVKVNGLAKSEKKHWSNYSVEEGDIFFTRTSETIEEIGISSVCEQKIEKATFAGFLIRFRPFKNILDIGFSKYYFRCIIPRIFFVKEMNLVTRASLSQELLKRLPVILPSMDDQTRMAYYLDNKIGKLNFTIEKISKEIELLKEYKTTLISEVVTGKVDVRDAVLN